MERAARDQIFSSSHQRVGFLIPNTHLYINSSQVIFCWSMEQNLTKEIDFTKVSAKQALLNKKNNNSDDKCKSLSVGFG